jgi:hypothetical protein
MNLLKYRLLIVLLFSSVAFNVGGQNFIGMDKEDIAIEIKKRYPGLKANTNFINNDYKYLKYEDKINEVTMLFFLSDDNKCTLVRKMCDYSNLNDEISNLNTTYKPSGKDQWSYEDRGKKYLVFLEEGEWYFTITTKLKK